MMRPELETSAKTIAIVMEQEHVVHMDGAKEHQELMLNALVLTSDMMKE